jgi:hypothetical protein
VSHIDDSFGFGRMLRDYSFTVHFVARRPQQTSVRIETFYSPANPAVALLNRLIMRHKFRRVVDALLDGLRTSAEQRHRAAARARTTIPPRHVDRHSEAEATTWQERNTAHRFGVPGSCSRPPGAPNETTE